VAPVDDVSGVVMYRWRVTKDGREVGHVWARDERNALFVAQCKFKFDRRSLKAVQTGEVQGG
jgi:hypothetical protein